MPHLSIQALFEARREKLQLTFVAGHAGADRTLTQDALNRAGVGLVGHLNLIHPLHIQALGASDLAYLAQQSEATLTQSVEQLCTGETLAVFVCDALEAPPFLVAACNKFSTPLFTSQKASRSFVNLLRPFLQRELSEISTVHGVFLDVLGFGTLIMGESSIGKSELALELISRGAGLVADDSIELFQIGPETIQGRCPPLLRDFLEVRGLGFLNINTIFGETAVRPRKTLRLIVHLERPTKAYFEGLDRVSPSAGTQTILGVEIPTVTLAVVAGRNLAVLVEAAVRNYILQTRGYDSNQEFLKRHELAMRLATEAEAAAEPEVTVKPHKFEQTGVFNAFGNS